jgi:mono/diheme cytochrome c family protein
LLAATLSLSATAFDQTAKTDAQAAKTDLGKKEFELQCSVCHGMNAKGDGLLVAVLKVVPPDLTTLAKKNGGVFPADRISSVIDGRAVVASHGSREMPIWGNRYAINAGEYFADVPFPFAREVLVHVRLLLLVDYLNRIQQK